MSIIVKLLTVIGLGIVELWAAIPAGIAFDFPPVLTGIASAAGALIAAVLVVLLGDKIRKRLLKKTNKGEKSKGRIYKIWDKYGVVGLGMLSPLITGALLGAAIGISLGAVPKKLMIWMSIGIVAWAAILTTIGTLGVAGLQLFRG